MTEAERKKWLAHLKALEGLLERIDEFAEASGYDQRMREKFLNSVLDQYSEIKKMLEEDDTD